MKGFVAWYVALAVAVGGLVVPNVGLFSDWRAVVVFFVLPVVTVGLLLAAARRP